MNDYNYFSEYAELEADRLVSDIDNGSQYALGFRHGIESGILHLASQLLREDVIEAGARKFVDLGWQADGKFDSFSVSLQNDFREQILGSVDAMFSKIAEGVW